VATPNDENSDGLAHAEKVSKIFRGCHTPAPQNSGEVK
jgi:hypothetical protein